MGSERMAETPAIPVLLITGPVGVGKTTVAGEVSALLARAGAAHALVDIDGLSECYPPPPGDPFNEGLALRNLAAVWANYRAAGAERLVLARVLESRAELERYRVAVPGAAILVVRLRASVDTLTGRVRHREAGAGLAWHVARAAELAAQMDRDRVEDVVIETDGRPIVAIARDVLARTGWPAPPDD